jgi:putative salt-induced outer membrane protein YdiY
MGLAEHDSNANVDLRATAGVGYGYQFVDQEDLQYSAEVGVNYFATTYIDVPPGEPEDDNRMTARIASDLTWHPAEEWSVGNLIETYPPLESGKNWYTRADTRIRYDLSEVIFTQLQWLVDYNSEPAPDSKSTDHRLFFTVGWTF